MGINEEKLEQTVLALLQMNLSGDSGRRAWKSLPWTVMDSLHQKGLHLGPSHEEQIRVVNGRGCQAVRGTLREALRGRIGLSGRNAATLNLIVGTSTHVSGKPTSRELRRTALRFSRASKGNSQGLVVKFQELHNAFSCPGKREEQ